MNKFKIGDMVKLINYQKPLGEMLQYVGTTAILTHEYAFGSHSWFNVDNNNYAWCETWMELVEESIVVNEEDITTMFK